jgi:hypothetical protein
MRVYKDRIWMNRVMGVDLRQEVKEWDKYRIIILEIRGWDDVWEIK